jgi:hypothetical protein
MWLWFLILIPPLIGIVTNALAPQPHGHWVEHLNTATFKASQLVLLLVLVAMLGWRRLRPALVIAFVVVAVGIVFQVIGDFRVANSIWRTVGDPGFGPGYVEGHDMSGLGDTLVVLGGLAWAVIVGVTRRVPLWLALITAFLVIIPPPFLWPAVGVLVVLLFGLTTRTALDARSRRLPEVSVTPTG